MRDTTGRDAVLGVCLAGLALALGAGGLALGLPHWLAGALFAPPYGGALWMAYRVLAGDEAAAREAEED